MSDQTPNTNGDAGLDELLAYVGEMAAATPAVRKEPPAKGAAASYDNDEMPEMPVAAPAAPSAAMARARAAAQAATSDDGDDPLAFLESTGLQAQREVPNITKPWMKHHEFVLVRTVDEVDRIVDEAIKVGKCSLDLETQGLDTRIDYIDGKPASRHKVVGYCISVGDAKIGYYIPVRHQPTDDGPDMNLPADMVEAAISRLCWAAQPVPEDNVADPLSFKEQKRGPQVVIDFWNAKFDQEMLLGVTGIDWWHPDSFEDAMLASFVVYTDDKSLSLKDKAKELLRDPDGNPYEMIKLKELFTQGRRISFPSLSPDEPGVVKYACSDAVCTRLLGDHPDILPRVRKRKDLSGTYRIEKQTIQVVRVMERNRVRIDREKIRTLQTEVTKKRDEIRAKVIEVADSKGFRGFEPNSPKQLGEFLFGEQGMNIIIPNNQDFPNGKPPINEKSKQYKTDASTLEQAADTLGEAAPPILKWIITMREHEKMLGTYLGSLVNNPDANEELRFAFKETGAATGRFSAPQGQADQGYSGVPVHGIPGTSTLREAFVARPGYTMVKSDFAGEELRIAANVSGEMVWIKEFMEGDGDLHSITARAFFNVDKPSKEQRKMGKIANFALVYGGGPAAIMRATGCDKVEASRRKQAFDRAVPTFAKWIKNQHKLVKEKKGVWTAFGRWIAIPDADHPDQAVRAACERHSTNYPIQGSGADIMKIVMILLHKEFYKRGWLKTGGGSDIVRMLLTVHDEIVFEIKHEMVPEVLPIIVHLMESPWRMPRAPHSPEWRVPLIVEPLLGLSWGGIYNWEHLTLGKKGGLDQLKDNEKQYYVQVGDRIYMKTPPWLEGILKPGWEGKGTPEPGPATPPAALPPTPSEAPPAAPDTAATSSAVPDTGADVTNDNMANDNMGEGALVVDPPPRMSPVVPVHMDDLTPASRPMMVNTPTPSTSRPAASASPAPGGAPGSQVVNFRINRLTRDTVKILRAGLSYCLEVDAGYPVRITDGTGVILVDPRLGIQVDPELLLHYLRERTLSDGSYWFDELPRTR
jgi:DNA polymerase I-like protein with 3'-5' exonuclease and polymerase domains